MYPNMKHPFCSVCAVAVPVGVSRELYPSSPVYELLSL
jgi:hypothetical protein